MKRLLSLLLTAALLLSLLAVCGTAAKADANDPCVLARQYATRVSPALTPKHATRGSGDCMVFPSIDMDGQTFLIGSSAAIQIGIYNPGIWSQSYRIEIYKGGDINKIKDSDRVTKITGAIRSGAFSMTDTLYWETAGKAAGDYLIITSVYNENSGEYLPDSFYYAKFRLVTASTPLSSISLRDADTDAVITDKQITVPLDGTMSFYTVYNPYNATGNRVKELYSSVASVAEVQEFGGFLTVVPKLPGKTRITVAVNGKAAGFDLVVSGTVNLKLNKTFASIKPDESFDLIADITPAQVKEAATLTWSSDYSEIVSVFRTAADKGWVVAQKPGTATITCTATYGGMTITATCKVSVPEADDPCADYTDVDRSLWYHEGVDFAIENGLMSSTEMYMFTFEPNKKLTRSMVATILYRLAGSPEMSGTYAGTFTDVKEGQWYTPTVEWCAANGLASGKGDGKFDPNGNVTRQELAIFMYRLAEYLKQDVSGSADLDGFADAASVPAWAESFVKWAVSAGLISGKANGDKLFLAPADTASRAEFACIAKRMVENLTDPVIDPDPTEDTDPTEELPPVEDPNPVTKP